MVGLFVGIATQMQIKATSSLTHNISGVMKNCLQTFMGSAVYRTKITMKGFCGLFLVVCGSGAYAIERINTNECKEEGKDIEKIQLVDSMA